MLLLHGFADNRATWSRVAPSLARRHRVVAADLPGFGASGMPPAGSLLDTYAGVVEDLADRLAPGGAPLSLVGNSMGGAVALRFALDHPHRVRRLVLIGCAGLAAGVPLWWRLLVGQLVPVRLLLGTLAGRTPAGLVDAAATRVYATLALHDAGAVPREALREFTRHYRTTADVDRLFRLGRRLIGELATGALAARAASLTVPPLLVWGRHDRLIPVAHAERLRAAVGGSRLVVIERCGHCPQVERPADLVAAVDPWLQGQPPPTGAVVVSADRLPG